MDPYRIFIKNMVCERCVCVIERICQKWQLNVKAVHLGYVELVRKPTSFDWEAFEKELKTFGFELLRDHEELLVEQIKTLLIRKFDQLPVRNERPISAYLSQSLHRDYSHLSKLFSKRTGTTIEHYFVLLRIEKAKELVSYKEHNFSEIAYLLGYSSLQHLSNQFKRVTGVSMTQYRKSLQPPRKMLDEIL